MKNKGPSGNIISYIKSAIKIIFTIVVGFVVKGMFEKHFDKYLDSKKERDIVQVSNRDESINSTSTVITQNIYNSPIQDALAKKRIDSLRIDSIRSAYVQGLAETDRMKHEIDSLTTTLKDFQKMQDNKVAVRPSDRRTNEKVLASNNRREEVITQTIPQRPDNQLYIHVKQTIPGGHPGSSYSQPNPDGQNSVIHKVTTTGRTMSPADLEYFLKRSDFQPNNNSFH